MRLLARMKESRDKQVKDLCDRLNEEHYAELQNWKETLRATERALQAKEDELSQAAKSERAKRRVATLESAVQTDELVEIVIEHGSEESVGVGRREAVGVQTEEPEYVGMQIVPYEEPKTFESCDT